MRKDVPQRGVLVYPRMEAGHRAVDPPGYLAHRAVPGVTDLHKPENRNAAQDPGCQPDRLNLAVLDD
jgi:hypothetical protein